MFRVFPNDIERYTKSAQELVNELSRDEIAYLMTVKPKPHKIMSIQNPSRAFQLINKQFNNYFSEKQEQGIITFQDLLWSAIEKTSKIELVKEPMSSKMPVKCGPVPNPPASILNNVLNQTSTFTESETKKHTMPIKENDQVSIDFVSALDNLSVSSFDDLSKYLEHGSCLGIQNSNGDTIVHVLAKNLNENYSNTIIKNQLHSLIQNYRADINVRNKDNLTPLQCVLNISNFQVKAAMFLVMNLHADPTVTNKNGDTLLHIIVKNKGCILCFDDQKSFISNLMNLKNNNIHILDGNGKTALYYLREKTRSTDEGLIRILNLNIPLPCTANSKLIPSEQIHCYENNIIQSGQSAQVYFGTWNNMQVAIKAITYDFSNLIKCNSELEIMQKLMTLKSNHIVNFLGYAIAENEYYIVMEYMAQDLRTYISKNTSLPYIDRLNIMLSITYGILVMHDQNILHLDIKPENILIEQKAQLTVKLCDFGATKEIDDKYDYVGTSGYIPPEHLLEHKKPHTKKSDIFGAGITFWEVIHLKTAYASINENQINRRVLCGYREPINKTACSSNIATLIDECLEEDPNDRPNIDKIESQLNAEIHKKSPF